MSRIHRRNPRHGRRRAERTPQPRSAETAEEFLKREFPHPKSMDEARQQNVKLAALADRLRGES